MVSEIHVIPPQVNLAPIRFGFSFVKFVSEKVIVICSSMHYMFLCHDLNYSGEKGINSLTMYQII